MLAFIAAMIDVGGRAPDIGDNDGAQVLYLAPGPETSIYQSMLSIGGRLFGRDDFNARAGREDERGLWLAGVRSTSATTSSEPRHDKAPARRSFPSGGYYVLGRDIDTPEEVRVVVDSGDLGYLSIAAHGHADALAMTLSIGGEQFLIDPGTYAYQGDRLWRDYFRSTRAHNTVCVDGKSQAVAGGNFMWLSSMTSQCISLLRDDERDLFSGSHDGYHRLPDPVHHRRDIDFRKDERLITITDTLECRGAHVIERSWHFASECDVTKSNTAVVASAARSEITISAGETAADIQLHRGETSPIRGWISPSFGVKHPTSTAVWIDRITGSTTLITHIAIGSTQGHAKS